MRQAIDRNPLLTTSDEATSELRRKRNISPNGRAPLNKENPSPSNAVGGVHPATTDAREQVPDTNDIRHRKNYKATRFSSTSPAFDDHSVACFTLCSAQYLMNSGSTRYFFVWL
jgi:hypothetical protein